MHEIAIWPDKMPMIRDLGFTYMDHDWVHPDRLLDYNVFILSLTGRMQVIEDGLEYFIEPGDVLFLKSGVHHWGTQSATPGSSTFWVHFYSTTEHAEARDEYVDYNGSTFFSRDFYNKSITIPKKFRVKNSAPFESKLKEMYHQLYYTNSSYKPLISSSNFYTILIYLLKALQVDERVSKPEVTVQRMIGYLEENVNRSLSSDDISQHFNSNYTYLGTIFKQATGTTISKFHARLRCNKAIEIMRSSNCNVSEVAQMVGYDNPLYFSRVFKKIVGESPTEFIGNQYKTSHLLHQAHYKSTASMRQE